MSAINMMRHWQLVSGSLAGMTLAQRTILNLFQDLRLVAPIANALQPEIPKQVQDDHLAKALTTLMRGSG